jgi:hypothetical protein
MVSYARYLTNLHCGVGAVAVRCCVVELVHCTAGGRDEQVLQRKNELGSTDDRHSLALLLY